jgi:hypothetical protein
LIVELVVDQAPSAPDSALTSPDSPSAPCGALSVVAKG